MIPKGSQRPLCRKLLLIWVVYILPQVKLVFTQHKTTHGVAENVTDEMRSFSENEIRKLKDRYEQRPGGVSCDWDGACG